MSLRDNGTRAMTRNSESKANEQVAQPEAEKLFPTRLLRLKVAFEPVQ